MKIKKQNNKVAVLALSSLLVVGMVAGTLAVFNTDFEVGNNFKVGNPGGKFVETFKAPTSEIVYDGEFEKSGSVYNLGEVALYAKAEITAEWSGDNNDFNGVLEDKLNPSKNKFAATLNFEDTADITDFEPDNIGVTSSNNKTASWKYDSNKNAFLYYGADGTETKQVPIPAKEESKPFLSSVKFDKNDLVEVEGSNKYYIADGWDSINKKPTLTATPYDTQDKAVDALKLSASTDRNIYYYEESVLTHPDYKGELDVTITCVLSDEAF